MGLLNAGSKIVVKIGSSILASDKGELDKSRLAKISAEICALKKAGFEMIVVTSGAIACGMLKLGLKVRPKTILEACSTAAVGQILLMLDYEECFRRDGFLTAQILLTSDGFQDRGRYLNARNTILNLLEKGNIIPVVNENDAVATDEIKFGDNDQLSSQVATLIDAKLLIILSDVDGVYDQNKKVIKKVTEIDSCILDMAKGTKNATSVGGMVTKMEAARIATNSGITVVIANGHEDGILQKLTASEEKGTWFYPKPDKIPAKKRWIAFSCKDCGKIIVDDGAKTAIQEKGKSLLAIGVKAVEGDFSFGDLVVIYDEQRNEIARGLINYSSQELNKIRQKKTSEIENILGYKSYDEVIHRDNLAVIR